MLSTALDPQAVLNDITRKHGHVLTPVRVENIRDLDPTGGGLALVAVTVKRGASPRRALSYISVMAPSLVEAFGTCDFDLLLLRPRDKVLAAVDTAHSALLGAILDARDEHEEVFRMSQVWATAPALRPLPDQRKQAIALFAVGMRSPFQPLSGVGGAIVGVARSPIDVELLGYQGGSPHEMSRKIDAAIRQHRAYARKVDMTNGVLQSMDSMQRAMNQRYDTNLRNMGNMLGDASNLPRKK